MISQKRMKEIIERSVEFIAELIGSRDDDLYNALSNGIGMTDNEIDEFSGNFQEKEFESEDVIYTRNEAADIVEAFEDILSEYDIYIPSPEDDDRDEEYMIGLYGSTYSDLLDYVEWRIISVLNRHNNGSEVVEYKFS